MVEGGLRTTTPLHAPASRCPRTSSHDGPVRCWANLIIRLGAFLICVGGPAACGPRHTLSAARPHPTSPVTRISVQRAVRAMQHDVFFSNYNTTTLLIRGTVSFIMHRGSATTLTLGSRGGSVQCDLGNRPPRVLVGHAVTIKVANPQQDVSRAPEGLTISPCRLA